MMKEIKRSLPWLFLGLSFTSVAMDLPGLPTWENIRQTLDEDDGEAWDDEEKENQPTQCIAKVRCKLTYPKRAPRGPKDPSRFDIEIRKKFHFDKVEKLQSQLLKACIEGDYDTVKGSLDAGAVPNMLSVKHSAPLFATMRGLKANRTRKGQYSHIITLLIAKGADVRIQDEKGDTLLHYAVTANSPELFSFFVKEDPSLLIYKNDAGLLPKEVVEGDDTLLMKAILATHYTK